MKLLQSRNVAAALEVISVRVAEAEAEEDPEDHAGGFRPRIIVTRLASRRNPAGKITLVALK